MTLNLAPSGDPIVDVWNGIAATDFEFFVEYVSRGRWQRAPHLHLLAQKLMAVERHELQRLIVSMPPQNGKSELVSKHFPAWYLGRNPDNNIIISSYSADLAYDFSRFARDLLKEWGPKLWDVRIAHSTSAVERWGLESRRGAFVAAGVGGPITGRGAHVAIVDDPFKNAEEANSATIRQTRWEWYLSTLRTRLAPDGAIVLVQTRWHEDDLAGKIIKQAKETGEHWEVISFPAIAEENDVLGRNPGEALWPERYPLGWLEMTRATLGSYFWSALYQQRPQPSGGGIFKRDWFRYYTRETIDEIPYFRVTEHLYDPFDCKVFVTVDLAASLKDSADYTVVAVWALSPKGDLILVDLVRQRLEGPDQRRLIIEAYERYSPVQIGIERAGYQLVIIQELVNKGLPVVELVPDRDKLSRALVATARYEAGKVFHPFSKPWLDDFENELLLFPKAEHDDCVDCCAYAARMIVDMLAGAVEVVVGRDEPGENRERVGVFGRR